MSPASAYPKILLALDPGTEQAGIAVFRNGKLDDVDVLRVQASQGNKEQRASFMARKVILWAEKAKATKSTKIVMEYPQIYRHGAGADVDPDDVLALVLVVGHVWGACHAMDGNDVSLVRPAAWKGQVPKRIMNARIVATLDVTERDLVERNVKSNHNALDAVGVGLWALRRPWSAGGV